MILGLFLFDLHFIKCMFILKFFLHNTILFETFLHIHESSFQKSNYNNYVFIPYKKIRAIQS